MRNLQDRIPNAPNFKYIEFVKSSVAQRCGIDNIPPNEHIWRNIERLAVNVLQPIRNEFGRIYIESGYRCPKLNAKIGGSPTSNHCRAEAADIEPVEAGVTLLQILRWAHDNLNYRELIAEYFIMGWIHIAYRENHNIKKLKLKDKTHHYTSVNIDYIEDLYRSEM